MSDFSSGADVGFRIQQRLLAKELRKLEEQRYNEERDYRRGRDKVADAQHQADIDERWSKWEYDAQRQKERDAVMDARDQRDYGDRRGDKMLDQVRQALDTASERRRRSAEIERILAQAKYYNAGGAPGRAAIGYDEYGPDGELVKRRVPVGAGSGAPTVDASGADPEAQALANEIAKLQTEIGQQRVAVAGGDNRTGFLNLRSRQGIIDDAQRKIAGLQRMQGGQQQPAQTGLPQAPQQPAAALSPQDQQALAWAKANPNDPRAAAILQRLGVK